MQKVNSPITKTHNVSLLRNIEVKDIIKVYKSFKIDVSNYFFNLKTISVYQCNDTGYMFYYPFNIAGDSSFYEHFQKFDWYYMPWKWEHEISQQYLKANMKVLEVGCAHGAFLKKVSENFNLSEAIGLELNETSPLDHDKFKIYNESIQTYSKTKKEYFDIVCSYEVLEHIADVSAFLNAKIYSLRKGGKLIISVPNNDSFIKFNSIGLNSPPHHMGLWNVDSLKALEQNHPIKLDKIHIEELQEYHVGNYVYFTYYSKYPKLMAKILLRINKILGRYNKQFTKTKQNRKNIIGHTILAVYTKI